MLTNWAKYMPSMSSSKEKDLSMLKDVHLLNKLQSLGSENCKQVINKRSNCVQVSMVQAGQMVSQSPQAWMLALGLCGFSRLDVQRIKSWHPATCMMQMRDQTI